MLEEDDAPSQLKLNLIHITLRVVFCRHVDVCHLSCYPRRAMYTSCDLERAPTTKAHFSFIKRIDWRSSRDQCFLWV